MEKAKMKPVSITALALFFSFSLLTVPSDCLGSYDVIVVRGDVPTDYIVASIYSSTKKIPLVLLDPEEIQSDIRSELSGYMREGNRMLLIIGGKNAISVGVENELSSMGFIVSRLWDWNRYGTAARVSIDLWGESDEVVITNGENYDYFLLAQRVALIRGEPILFIKNETITMETADALMRLGTKSVVLVSQNDNAASTLRSLGLSVDMVETTPKSLEFETESEPVNLGFYALLIGLLAVIAFLSFKFWKARKVSVMLLTDDEEKIVEILKMRGKTEQSKLSKLTGFSKPRISRMLMSLEERGVVERERYKKTFKIKLKSKF